MENKKPKDPQRKKLFRQVLITAAASTLIATGASIGITYAIASKQLKLPSYTVTFKNWDGTILQQSKVQIGGDAKYTGATPTRPTVNYVDYSFKGWDRDLTNIIADREITAQYNETRQTYTMTWYDEDGKTVIDTKTCYKDEIAEGKMPQTEKTPTKPSSSGLQYSFDSWKYEQGEGWKEGKFSATAVYDEAQEGLTISGGTITNYTGSAEDVTIPEVWGGQPVTTIGSYAFTPTTNKTTSIKTITIPKTVTTIQENAFVNATDLTAVTFNESSTLETIGNNAFANCTALTNFDIPDSTENVKNRAFYKCTNLQSLRLGANVSRDGFDSGSLIGCSNLSKVTVSSDNKYFTTISGYPGFIFSKDEKILIRCCPANTFTGNLPSSIEVVTSLAFQGCTKISAVSFADCDKLHTIDAQAFAYSSITEFTSGDSITTLGSDIFRECSELTKIKLGKKISLDSEWDSFSGCSKLKTIEVDSENPNMYSWNGMVYNRPSTGEVRTLIRCPITCPVYVDGQSKILEECTKIGPYAFQGCTELKEFTVPSHITSIDKYAFTQCPNLTKITIGEGDITSIGEQLFNGCPKLETIKIGAHLVFSAGLNASAWAGCPSIKKIEVDSSNVTFKAVDDILYGYDGTGAWLLRYPPAIESASFTIPASVQFVGKDVPVTTLARLSMSECNNLETIILPTSLTRICDNAFESCTKLSTVELPINFNIENITSIGKDIFKNCTTLSNVTIHSTGTGEMEAIAVLSAQLGYKPLSVKILPTSNAIAQEAFIQSTSINKVVIGNTPLYILNNAFQNCKKLTTVELPSSLIEIGDYAFANDSKLETIEFKEGLQKIGSNAFRDCQLLKMTSLPTTLKTIGDLAFYQCLSITSLDLTNVTSIGEWGFVSCLNLESIKLPKKITIGNSCFNNCQALYSVTYNGTIEEYHANIRAQGHEFEIFSSDDNLHEITCTNGPIKKQ